MISIKDLSKSFNDVDVLKNINLDIKDGEIYGLIGRSGAGKSTLLRCINKLETFQNGTIDIDGVKVEDLSGKGLREFRREVGMIFQHFSLMQKRTMYENIALPMECWGYEKSEIDSRVKELAEIVEISSKLESKPKELSGGQQQRVAIARALAMNSKILLSDEATSALDPKTTDSIIDLLKNINKKFGITIVVVAHQMEVIKSLCDKVAILDKGEIVLNGKVDEIFLRYQDELKDILGGGEEILLPKTGTNIKIISSEKDRPKKIISSMARDLNIGYSVPWSTIETFKDSLYAVIYANIENEDLDKVSTYLDEKEMEWSAVDNEQ